MFKKLVLNMNFDFYLLLLLLLLSLLQLQCDARLSCEIKYSQTRLTYNVSNDAAAGIILSPGTGIDYMQVFHCTCPTNNEIFDDTEVTNVDRDFYQVNQFDWTQSQIFHINNCVTLTLSLRSGKNTFSNLLKGKLLIVENIRQLIMTAFSAGAPSVTTEDDVFSSIYFRNVTFYQIPPYFEFDDRYEVLFSNVYTDEGSNKIEPFDIRVKNSNFTRNPVFRMENSRFGGINVISDGYSFNVFSLTVQNLQLASNNSCNYDYHGSVRLVGNTFGYLRARNIYITNAMEFWFENNYVDLLNSNAFDLSNLKQTRFQNNIFGYELQDPVINLAYYRGGTGSCQSQDLPEQMVSMIDFSMNRVQRLETTFLNLRSDPNYSTGFINKINVNDIASTRPCNCTNPNIGFSPTDSQKLMSTAIQQSKCLSMHRVIGLRSDICSGKIPLTPEQEADRKARETRDNWLIYLIIAVAGTAIVVAILTAVCIKLCCKCKGDSPPHHTNRVKISRN